MSGPALSSPILFTSQLLCSAISFRAAALKKKDRPTRYIQPGPPNVEKKCRISGVAQRRGVIFRLTWLKIQIFSFGFLVTFAFGMDVNVVVI